MLNYRIRDLLFYYTKRCYFASILFGKSISKEMHHLSFRALANDVNGTESQPAKCPLFDCINEMMRDKR